MSAGPAGECPPAPSPARGPGAGAGPGRPRSGACVGAGAAGGAGELPWAPRPLPDRPRGGRERRVCGDRGSRGGGRRGLLAPVPVPAPLVSGKARGAPCSPPSRPSEEAPALGCRRAGEGRADPAMPRPLVVSRRGGAGLKGASPVPLTPGKHGRVCPGRRRECQRRRGLAGARHQQ